MAWKWANVLLLVTCVRLSRQLSTPESSSYVAAVIDFAPKEIDNDALSTLQRNVDKYVEYVKKASQNNADIIVFPEDGLTSLNLPVGEAMEQWSTQVPSVAEEYVPCKENRIKVSDALKKLSCAALENKIYVVANLAEKLVREKDVSACEGPQCVGTYYNTNVVFDRNGKIIARYRKTNLFAEPQFSVTDTPEVITFDTDFGVTFGTFICFDILFKEPALNLTRGKGVTDIVYPTAWFSETPFLTAIQTQYGWAYSEDVNLLASGYNNPKNGNTGSGVFLGRNGIARAVMSKTPVDDLMIVRVPKIDRKKDDSKKKEDAKQYHVADSGENAEDSLTLLREHVEKFTTEPLKDKLDKKLCHNNFCCQFNVETSKTEPNIFYRAAVFNGDRSYGTYNKAGVKVCAVVQCISEDPSTCGFARDTETTFSNILIEGTIDDYANNLAFPTLLNSSLLPVEGWTYDVHKHDSHAHFSLTSDGRAMKNVATFGVYARIFERDSASSAVTSMAQFFILVSSIVVLFLSS